MSFTRAAWLGLAAAACVLAIFRLRIRLSTLLVFAALAGGYLWANSTDIYLKLKDNKKVSSNELEGHLESISNISTDASNTERINRWESAIRMFKERPVVGWGPGTYMFQYAPFQMSYEMTIISTRAGIRGNAHSEYIGPLAESGVLGTLTFLGIVFISFFKGMNLVYHGRNNRVRVLATGITLGLITYYVHGTINNYLDLDKAAVPFWAFLAVLTALELYHNQPDGEEQNGLTTISPASLS
jgi:O-antigen ligase